MPLVPSESQAIYVGIDPGSSGGLAALHNRPSCVSMPDTDRDLWDWISQTADSLTPVFAVIEKVSGWTGGNKNKSGAPYAHEGAPGSAMFKFGTSYGGLRMALVAAGIPFEEVVPRTWQKALGITPRAKTESKGQFKNRLKAKAQQLFPSEKVTLATADALLIAEYCRRKQEGKL